MARLEVYVDESGTPQENDEGDVFLAAAVAVEAPLGGVPIITEDHDADETVHLLRAVAGHLGYAYVLPHPGYADALRQLMRERNRLAQTSHQFDQCNAAFFSAKGLNTASWIWVHPA